MGNPTTLGFSTYDAPSMVVSSGSAGSSGGSSRSGASGGSAYTDEEVLEAEQEVLDELQHKHGPPQ